MDLSDAVRAEISKFCGELRKTIPAARWVRPEGMHVTLKFIGEVGEEKLQTIRTALTNIHSDSPVEMTVQGVGFFPNERRPRVFWAGISHSPNLGGIAADIESRLETLGIAKETREFKPHLTLARLDDSRGIQELLSAIRQEGEIKFGEIHANEFNLYQSELSRGGAKYTRLATFQFTPEASS
jgi:2'-5' RNA ligase